MSEPISKVQVHSGDIPIELVGDVNAIRGQIMFRNPGSQKQVLRDVRLTGEGLPHPIDLPRLSVRANAVKNIPVMAFLQTPTAPGSYDLQLEYGGECHPVKLTVPEMLSLAITPNELFIESAPGEKVCKQLIINNLGNVPINIRALGAAQLEVDLLHCRAQRAALAALKTQKDITVDAVLTALFNGYSAELNKFTPLKLYNDPITVEAGNTGLLNLTIQLPSKMPKNVPAIATINILNETLSIHVTAV